MLTNTQRKYKMIIKLARSLYAEKEEQKPNSELKKIYIAYDMDISIQIISRVA